MKRTSRRRRPASTISLALATVVATVAATIGLSTAGATAFDDVESGAYYSTAVDWMVAADITTGTSAQTFSPDSPVTRAQFATFLWRLAGEPSAGGSAGFSDVSNSDYYATAVRWMANKGITTGTTATTFSPGASLTRAQAATFIWRYADQPDSSDGFGFADVSPNSFAAEAIRWMAGMGITKGTSATEFSPGAVITRGQAATFLYRFATGGGGGELSWAPPSGWQNYRRINVSTNGGSIDLGNSQDALLVMPNQPVRGTVFVRGGRNVVMIGGTVSIESSGSYDSEAMGLRFRDQTGTIHVEGVHLTGSKLTEGIQFDAPDADAVVQNVRIDTIIGSSDDNHADLIQPWGGLESLRIDRLTGTSRFQGLMLKADSNGPLGPVTVRRVDITIVEGNHESWAFPDNGGRYGLWVGPSHQADSVHYDAGTVWVDTNSSHNNGNLRQNVWPHPRGSGSDSTGSYVEWTNTSNVSGRVYKGIPPQGDYVPVGVAGTSYDSPGYVG